MGVEVEMNVFKLGKRAYTKRRRGEKGEGEEEERRRGGGRRGKRNSVIIFRCKELKMSRVASSQAWLTLGAPGYYAVHFISSLLPAPSSISWLSCPVLASLSIWPLPVPDSTRKRAIFPSGLVARVSRLKLRAGTGHLAEDDVLGRVRAGSALRTALSREGQLPKRKSRAVSRRQEWVLGDPKLQIIVMTLEVRQILTPHLAVP